MKLNGIQGVALHILMMQARAGTPSYYDTYIPTNDGAGISPAFVRKMQRKGRKRKGFGKTRKKSHK